MRSFRPKVVLLCFAAVLLAATCARPAPAAIIVGDSALLDFKAANQLEAWLGQKPIELTRIYQKLDGHTSEDFHNAVDGQGRTFSVVEVRENAGVSHQIIGGYNPQSWSSTGGYNLTPADADRTAFLFNLTSNEIQRQNLSSEANNGYDQTLNDGFFGPTFGGGNDLWVNTTLDAGYANNYSYGGTTGVDNIVIDGGYVTHNLQYGQIEVFTIKIAKALPAPEPGPKPKPAPTAAVPEPASLLVWSGLALLGLTARLRLAIGDRVKILRGALAGLKGTLKA